MSEKKEFKPLDVGATERLPWELAKAFREYVSVDDKGNFTFGANVTADGTIGGNSGLKPIHTFTWSITQDDYQRDYTIESLYETTEGTMGYTIFNGYLRIHVNGIDVKEEYAIIGEYSSYRGQVNEVNGVVFGGYPVTSIIQGTSLQLFSYNSATNKATFTNYAITDNTQSKLYRHVIMLSGASSSDGTCMLEYISPKDLVCDSLQDLRTVLGNPQMQSYVASNPSGDLFGVVISPSTAQFKKAGTTELINITTVSDTVTTL